MAASAVLKESGIGNRESGKRKESGIGNPESGSTADRASNIDYLAHHIQSDQRQKSEERTEPSTINHQPFFKRAYRYIQSISEYAPSFGSKFRIESIVEDSNWADRKNKKRKTAKKRVKDLKKMW
jgi:CRISPR/Cas system endoribonuclease Cas6 (RAMP superfamily)